MSDDTENYADLSEGVPSRRPPKLRSKVSKAPEEVSSLAEKADQHAREQGYGRADPDVDAVRQAEAERRLHITVPEGVHDQIRRRMLEYGDRSTRSYILRVLRDAGEIEISDDQIQDRRGQWMRKAFRPRS